jgi:pimeloyl-ACP methyl ester carboxylesterase
MDQLEVAGLRIAYEQAGEGPALLLLHGAYCDSRVWRWQLEELSDAFTIVAWDAPGCGLSSNPPESWRLSDYADCLAAFIETLGLAQPHVLGLSFGAVLAQGLYREHAKIPKSLVLASAYAGWAGSLPPEVVKQRMRQNLNDAGLPPEQVVASYVPGLLTEAAPQALIDEVTRMMLEFRPVGIRTMTYACGEADLRDVLPRIDVPTLLLYGDKDVRSPMTVAEDIHSRIPNSKLVVIPGASHLNNVEAAERFNSEVRGFLKSVQN